MLDLEMMEKKNKTATPLSHLHSDSADSNCTWNDSILSIDLKYITLKTEAAISEIRSAKARVQLESRFEITEDGVQMVLN